MRQHTTITVQEHPTAPFRVHVEVVYDHETRVGWASLGGVEVLRGTPENLVGNAAPSLRHAVAHTLLDMMPRAAVAAPVEPPSEDAIETKPDAALPTRRRRRE